MTTAKAGRTRKEQAEYLGTSVRTIDRMRAQRVGPPWAKVGAQIIYPQQGTADWLESKTVYPVREATA